jgi:hypothetical protein
LSEAADFISSGSWWLPYWSAETVPEKEPGGKTRAATPSRATVVVSLSLMAAVCEAMGVTEFPQSAPM